MKPSFRRRRIPPSRWMRQRWKASPGGGGDLMVCFAPMPANSTFDIQLIKKVLERRDKPAVALADFKKEMAQIF